MRRWLLCIALLLSTCPRRGNENIRYNWAGVEIIKPEAGARLPHELTTFSLCSLNSGTASEVSYCFCQFNATYFYGKWLPVWVATKDLQGTNSRMDPSLRVTMTFTACRNMHHDTEA